MENTEIENKQKAGKASYDRGLDLEQRFCEFMKTELGYKEALRNTVQHSVNNPSGIKLDIMAKKNSRLGKLLMPISIALSFITIFIMIGGLLYCYYAKIEFKTSMVIIACVTEVAGIAFYILSNKYTTELAWVECKNWERKVNIADIDKMLFEYRSNKKSRDSKHKFKYRYFVSAHGYVYNAQVHAEQNGIICYICSESGFEKTELP